MAARTLVARSSLVIGFDDPLLIGVWTGKPPTVADVRESIGRVVGMLDKGRRHALVACVHPDLPLPDDAVRAAVQEEMKRLDPFIACGATIIPRDGFAGVAVRALTSTLQLLSRPTHPERIVKSAAEAAAFLGVELERANVACPSETELTRSIQAFVDSHWTK